MLNYVNLDIPHTYWISMIICHFSMKTIIKQLGQRVQQSKSEVDLSASAISFKRMMDIVDEYLNDEERDSMMMNYIPKKFAKNAAALVESLPLKYHYYSKVQFISNYQLLKLLKLLRWSLAEYLNAKITVQVATILTNIVG